MHIPKSINRNWSDEHLIHNNMDIALSGDKSEYPTAIKSKDKMNLFNNTSLLAWNTLKLTKTAK